jgi:malate dehydrogenase
MSRDDLVRVNFDIMKSIAPKLVEHCPNAIIIPVANPLDAMAQALFKLTKFPKERIIGMAGVLDSARMSTFVAMELNVSVENVSSFVLGGHGDTMVPLPRYSTVAGIPITDLLSKEKIDAIVKRTRAGIGTGETPWDERLVRRVSGHGDGRSDPEGQEEDPAVFRVPTGRVASTICSSVCP